MVVRIELIFSSSLFSDDLGRIGFVLEFTGVKGEDFGEAGAGDARPCLLLRCPNKPEDLESGRLDKRLLDLRGRTGDTGDTGEAAGEAGDCVAFWRLSNTCNNGDCSPEDESFRTHRFSVEVLGCRERGVSSSSIILPALPSEYSLRLEAAGRKIGGGVLTSETDEELPFLDTTILLSWGDISI